jgi:hypothetical protein
MKNNAAAAKQQIAWKIPKILLFAVFLGATRASPSKNVISFGEGLAPSDLKSNFENVLFAPTQCPSCAFHLAVPTLWKRGEIDGKSLLEGKMVSVALFDAPSGESIQVLATRLPYEVNPLDWLAYQCERNHSRILAAQTKETPHGLTVHAAAETEDGAFLRLAVINSGPDTLLFVGQALKGSSKKMLAALGASAASFELAALPLQPHREELKVYEDPQGLFKVSYPVSWVPHAESDLPPTKSGVIFRILENHKTLAYMRVEADRRYPRDAAGHTKIFDLTTDEVNENVGQIIHLDPLPAIPAAGEKQRWLGRVTLSNGLEQTLALVLKPAPKAWLIVVMIAPDQRDNLMASLRAMRFYELAVASLSQ